MLSRESKSGTWAQVGAGVIALAALLWAIGASVNDAYQSASQIKPELWDTINRNPLYLAALIVAGVGAVIVAVSGTVALFSSAHVKYAASVVGRGSGSKYLNLARSDGTDMGYPVAHVWGPRTWGRWPDRGAPREPKRAREGRVTYVFPDHYGDTEGPRPEQLGRYRVRWTISQHADPAIRESFKPKTVEKSTFRITEEDNRAAEEALIPDTYSVHARRDGDVIRLTVLRDRDGAAKSEHHIIAVTDPLGVQHLTFCKDGEFVYPTEYRVGSPANVDEPSPPLIPGRYYLEGQTCTFVMHSDGSMSDPDRTAFARGLLEVGDSGELRP